MLEEGRGQCLPMLNMTGTFLSSQILPLKGKWEALRQRKLNISDLALTQDPNCLDEQGFVLSMQGNGGIQQQWTVEGRPVNQNVSSSSSAAARNEGDALLQQSSVSYQQEEMVSWLNYPVEENFSKPYCSDVFLDIPTGPTSTLRDFVDVRRQRAAAAASADEALALGAERAAGMSSQVGLEAFCRVRTTIQPPHKWPSAPPDLQSRRTASFPQFSTPGSPTATVVGESVQPLKTEPAAFLMSPAATGGRRSPKSTDNEKRAGKKKVELPEPTVTSSSGGSENTTDRPTEKRKISEITESAECQSEDVETESTETKKASRNSRPKRSRAAEVHNLSERRRRDRINEKMRALQELIPNSNKTDKASMLDEAIEYLKMLQLQLQMMSMRSGMSVPAPMPMMGIPPMQMQMPMPSAAMPAMHYGVTMGMGIGMGMNMGMGMGVNLVDPIHPASSCLGEVNDPPPQYLQQQQMPLQVMNMNRDIWMQQQHQQQQHQQQQHQQQQQQQQHQPH